MKGDLCYEKNLNCNSETVGDMAADWRRLSAYVILFFKGVMLCRVRLNRSKGSVFTVTASVLTPIQALSM